MLVNGKKAKKIITLFMALALLLAELPAANIACAAGQTDLTETTSLVIITAQCSIYSYPTTTESTIATAYEGSSYPYVSYQNTSGIWYEIQYDESSVGWVPASCASRESVECHASYSKASYLTRLVSPRSFTKLYSDCDTSSEPVCYISTNNVATVIDDGTGSDGYSWFKVKFGSTEGWISRRSVNITNIMYEIDDKTFSDDNVPVIYLSPSRQTWNPYSYGDTDECEQMYRVAESLKSILESTYVCKVYIADVDLKIDKDERPLEAASLGADIYLAIHSNATGSGRSAYGTMGYYYPGSAQSKELSDSLIKHLDAISPFNTDSSGSVDGMKYLDNYGYGEVRSPSAYGMISLLIEVQYHDNADSAEWIINNVDNIAQALADGMNEAFGFEQRTSAADKLSCGEKSE